MPTSNSTSIHEACQLPVAVAVNIPITSMISATTTKTMNNNKTNIPPRTPLPRADKGQKDYVYADEPLAKLTTIVAVVGKGNTLVAKCDLPKGTIFAKYNFDMVSKEEQDDYIHRKKRNADKCVELTIKGIKFYLIGNQRGKARGVLASNACLCVSNSQFGYSTKVIFDEVLQENIEVPDKCWLETTKDVKEEGELTWYYGCPWDWIKVSILSVVSL